MTYFADGSKYGYLPGSADNDEKNVGWLDAEVPFETGPINTQFLAKLKKICRHGVNRTRGLHRCNLCYRETDGALPPPTTVHSPEGWYVVGGAEIRVTGQNGEQYVAPDMIVHYVEAHNYRPADSFVQGVLKPEE